MRLSGRGTAGRAHAPPRARADRSAAPDTQATAAANVRTGIRHATRRPCRTAESLAPASGTLSVCEQITLWLPASAGRQRPALNFRLKAEATQHIRSHATHQFTVR